MEKVFYIVILAGCFLWQRKSIEVFARSLIGRRMLRHNFTKAGEAGEFKLKKGLLGQLTNLISATGADQYVKNAPHFMLLCFSLGIGIGVITFFIGGFKLALVSSVFTAGAPIFLMILKLNKKRISRSLEGDFMIQELLANYKIMDNNIKEAVDLTAEGLVNLPFSKEIIQDLSRGLSTAATKKQTEKAINRFKYSLGTSWGNALGTNIYFAQLHGIRITEALEDLAKTVSQCRKIVEHGNRQHNESKLIMKYLVPASYVLSVLCACKYFGFTLTKFIQYQFTTPLGLKWFVIMSLSYLFGVMINLYFSKEKMDI